MDKKVKPKTKKKQNKKAFIITIYFKEHCVLLCDAMLKLGKTEEILFFKTKKDAEYFIKSAIEYDAILLNKHIVGYRVDSMNVK